MQKPELVLSNTTSFFSGCIETVFKNAKKYGFKYVEIIPYRWTRASSILKWQKQYNVEVAGIHLPIWWQRPASFLSPVSTILNFYLGGAEASPAWDIARALLPRRPYLLFHTGVARQMANKFAETTKTFHAVIENIPYYENSEDFFWNPAAAAEAMKNQGLGVGIVFDHGHFNESRELLPSLSLTEIYQQARPEIIHISYNSRGLHLLPNKKEQEELKSLLRIHSPQYICIETYPYVSIKKAKTLLDQLLSEVILYPPS